MDRPGDLELQPSRLATNRNHRRAVIEVFDVTFNVNQQARTIGRWNDTDQEYGLNDRIVAIVEAQVDGARDLLAKLFCFSVSFVVAFGFEVGSRVDPVVFVNFSARFQHGCAQLLCRNFSFHDLPVKRGC